MDLDPGTRLGRYEIISLIGTGGMGAVYKAVDRKLDRPVALKVVRGFLPEQRARFEREARAVAALQHPRICTLLDVGIHEGTDYLVMEYLDGTTLQCPQPLDKIIEYGCQIADALDAANREGITHRDLKPANIIVTNGGVKLVDFGIAKTVDRDTLTEPGRAIGTPAYMAPEQWRGEPADHRTDIYALGCVLHEMASGHRSRETPLAHPRLEWIVRRCLAPDPDDRWQSARDVRQLLESIRDARLESSASSARAWTLIAVVAALTVLGVLAAWMFVRPVPSRPPYQLSIAPPSNGNFLFARNRQGGLAVSPDGTTIAFVAVVDGRIQLWTRRLDSASAQPVPGTDGAYYPFWSPDSQWIAYLTPNALMRVAVSGGAPRQVAPSDPRALGGSWGADDVILITSGGDTLKRVGAGGGVLSELMPGRWPHFLPDGKRFLFDRGGGVWVGSMAAGDSPRRLVESNAEKPAHSSGHLLFVRDRALVAQRFDPGSLQLSGEPAPVAEFQAGSLDNPADFSVTTDGLLAYGPGAGVNALVWRARSGKRTDDPTIVGDVATPRISPDGQQVVFARAETGNFDLWIGDPRRATYTRLTFDAGIERWPIWSPDGKTITYSSGTYGSLDLYRRASDGSGSAERLTNHPSNQHAMDWTIDNRYLSITRNVKNFGTDLMVVPAGKDAYPFLQTVVSEGHSQLEPRTNRWIAYSSDDSGRREIYVKPFRPGQPAPDARWQISSAGGTMPRWRRDGRELYYWALDGGIMAVAVDGSGAAFQWTPPIALFRTVVPTLRTNDINFDAAPDGQRFLLVEPADPAAVPPLLINTNWLSTKAIAK
jgi:Tol biopolymer transport system component/predicted Ser/Thr protein kinase